MIDFDKVHFEDLKAYDLGSWRATGTKRTNFCFTHDRAIRYSTEKPDTLACDCFVLTWRYYVHRAYDFYCGIVTNGDCFYSA